MIYMYNIHCKINKEIQYIINTKIIIISIIDWYTNINNNNIFYILFNFKIVYATIKIIKSIIIIIIIIIICFHLQ
jgi:hypothetical protein